MGKVIGIDLGTTNSCVAVLEGGYPFVISNSEGGRTTPSMVGFSKTGDRLIGQLAKRQAVTNAANTVFSMKRLIGRRWDDTEQERSRVPYTCLPGKDNTVNVQIRGQVYTLQEITAMLLQKLKQDAENYLGETVAQAVITVPACFSPAQQQATIDAGAIAGLEGLQIISEPIAATLAYGLNQSDQDECIIVFDLGGGTFDVSVLRLRNRVLEMIATCGSNHLGGDDFDDAIVQWLIESFQAQEGADLSIDKMALRRLWEAAEKAKIELSSTLTTSVNLPFITSTETGPKHLEIEITRAQFEALTNHLVERAIQLTEQVLKEAILTSDDIDRILLVGGSTRIPAVQAAIQKLLNHQPLDRSINPDEAIALGAAIQAGILNGETKDMPLVNITPSSWSSSSTTNMGGLSAAEIDRMRQETQMYAEANQERKALVEMKKQADALFYIYEIIYEITMRDNSKWISEELKLQAMKQVADLKAAIAKLEAIFEEIQRKLDALQQTLLDIEDDGDLDGGVAPVPRPWKPTLPPSTDGEAAEMQRKLDALQQTLIEIGISVSPWPVEVEDYFPAMDGEENDDDDATITADYEAID